MQLHTQVTSGRVTATSGDLRGASGAIAERRTLRMENHVAEVGGRMLNSRKQRWLRIAAT